MGLVLHLDLFGACANGEDSGVHALRVFAAGRSCLARTIPRVAVVCADAYKVGKLNRPFMPDGYLKPEEWDMNALSLPDRGTHEREAHPSGGGPVVTGCRRRGGGGTAEVRILLHERNILDERRALLTCRARTKIALEGADPKSTPPHRPGGPIAGGGC